MGERVSCTDEKKLKKLYVLLGRIGGLDEYVWENIKPTEQVKDFNKVYKELLDGKVTNANELEDRFTRASVLSGKITTEDIESETAKSFPEDIAIEIQEETLLHRAISLLGYKSKACDKHLLNIIKQLVDDIPFLLKYNRSGGGSPGYDGQSPLHLAVLKEDVTLVETLSEAIETYAKSTDSKEKSAVKGGLLDSVAKGSKFDGTVMMAGTPLCVAALTLNKKTFKILVRKGADITKKNKYDENVCHSMVRFAHYCPDKLDKICNMLDYILKCTWNKVNVRISDTQKLLMMENKDGLNPLQLATQFRLHQIFKQFYGHEVYCMKNLRNSLQDDQWYDVTEIDTLPVPAPAANGKTDANKKGHVSLLPTILLQSPQSAIMFLECPPIRQVIEQKWNRYKWFVWTWGVMHLMFMISLTTTAVARAQLTNDPVKNPNETLFDPPHFIYKVRKDTFVTVMGVIGCCIGFGYICLEIKRNIAQYHRKSVKLSNIYTALKYPHSNIIYKLFFVLFSLCLILDFLIAVIQVDTYENYMLIAAVILGSYLLLFFIQMIKPFSFFTALIQIAMVDLARFALVMVVFLLAFSTAVYMIMQGADSDDDTFRSFHSTLIKMFNVMLGLGDIESLLKARHPAAAVAVFITFVLLTTILLLNALLAIMANTCSSLLSRYGDVTAHTLHYRLHKLSTILFIEDLLPQQLQKGVGKIQKRKRFQGDQWDNKVRRRMIHHTCLAMKSEKFRVELSAFDGLMHYLGGRKSKSNGRPKQHILKSSRHLPGASITPENTTVEVQTMDPFQQTAFANTDGTDKKVSHSQ